MIDERTIINPLFFDEMNIRTPERASDLIIEPLNIHRACSLNEYWHSRFPYIHWSNVVRNKRYICFGASFDGLYYASAIWSSPIAANRMTDGETKLELRRMAISGDAPKNTATRMLKVMRKWIYNNFPEIKTLVSYQDTEAHHGTIYKADNWTRTADSGDQTDWTKSKRVRNAPQSVAVKVRWEYQLRNTK